MTVGPRPSTQNNPSAAAKKARAVELTKKKIQIKERSTKQGGGIPPKNRYPVDEEDVMVRTMSEPTRQNAGRRLSLGGGIEKLSRKGSLNEATEFGHSKSTSR